MVCFYHNNSNDLEIKNALQNKQKMSIKRQLERIKSMGILLNRKDPFYLLKKLEKKVDVKNDYICITSSDEE